MKTMALGTYINHKLKFYQYAVPFVSAVIVSTVAALFLLVTRVTFDQTTLKNIAPHISTLVESNDRTELARLIRSIAEERKSEISLIRDEKIMASSKSLDSFDNPYKDPRILFGFYGSGITKNSVVSVQKVARPSGPATGTTMILSSPLLPILEKCSLCALVVLLVGFAWSFWFAYQMKNIVQRSIEPIKNIDDQIREIKNLDVAVKPICTGISEFDAIQRTILDTKKVLIESRDIKAVARAREMTAERYQKLIHDLGTPVSALQQMFATANSTTDLEDKKKASEAIPKLAEQIISQVKTAKDNLAVDIDVLSEQDLRDCIEDSIFQSSQGNEKEIQIAKSLPNDPIVVPHDPAYLRRAISNVINNAIQASREKISVTMKKQDEKIVIRIEDDGAGINEALVSQYLQGKGISTKSNRRAFGLASANHIVKQHGGRIIARPSVTLGGACFEVQL